MIGGPGGLRVPAGRAVAVRLPVALALSALGRAPEIFEYELLATNLLNGLSLVYRYNGQRYQAFHSSLPYVALNAAVCRLTAHRHVFLLAAQAVLAGALAAVVAGIGTRAFDARVGVVAAARFGLPIACGIAPVLGPWVARNAVILGTRVMMTSSGENFWRGNNADATGTSLSLDGMPVLENSDPPFQARVRNLDELGQMRLFWAESWRFWRKSPGAALALTARKLYACYARGVPPQEVRS